MAAKRALIVDDSKSARVVLSRLLERHALAVDTRESAEDALEYLKAHRPDVIFMDHLMPGMDGFQAIQAIKNNPATATIPVMMYTSQEGELYVGQARALGASGVMPKQVAPMDVSKILYDLRLVTDRAEPAAGHAQPDLPLASAGPGALVLRAASGAPASPPAAVPAPESSASPAPPPDAAALPALLEPLLERHSAELQVALAPLVGAREAAVRAALEPLLREHAAELRRFVVAGLESFAARVSADLREHARSVTPPAPQPTPVGAARPWGWIACAALAVLAALGATGLAWQQQRTLAAFAAASAATSARASATGSAAPTVAGPAAASGSAAGPLVPEGTAGAAESSEVAADPAATAPPATGATAPPAPRTVAVRYGEPPLALARVEALRAYLAELESAGFVGVLRVTSHAGDFCLTGNPAEGYAPAPAAMPANRCDLVGNPFDDGLRASQRQSLPFANLVAAARARPDGGIEVEIAHAARARPLQAYPTAASASAAEWNAVAAANQRVEFRAEPRAAP